MKCESSKRWSKDQKGNWMPNKPKKKNMKRVILFIILVLAIIFTLLVIKTKFYSAGNLISLDYPVNSDMKTSVVHAYCDTLVDKYGYGVPQKWSHLNKLIEIDSNNNVRIYFKDSPEEMYLISFGGMLEITDVYNTNIRSDGGYVSKRDLVSKAQEDRIQKRFKNEVLDKILNLARMNGLPDSVIFKK